MEHRKERLAISINDVDRIPDELRVGMLAGRLDVSKIVRIELADRHQDLPAVEFCCPLLEAAVICDLIRSHDRKVGHKQTELYLNRGGSSWSRVTYATALTLSVNGKSMLNPAVFTDVRVVDTAREVKPLGRS